MTLAQAEAYLQEKIHPDLGGSYLQEQVMDEIDFFRQRYEIFPKQYISYQRAAYFGKEDADFRLTFDRALTGRRSDLSLRQQSYGDLLIPEQMRLMESRSQTPCPCGWQKNWQNCKCIKPAFPNTERHTRCTYKISWNGLVPSLP